MIPLRQIYAIGVNRRGSDMATFRKRSGGWRAEVCIKGTRASATFTTKREAQAWAAQEETKLREDAAGKIPNKPFRDLLERYSREVSIKKRGAAREQKMIDVILRDPVADVSLRMLAPIDIAAWRDRRLMQVSGSTVEREMTILSHACSVARREWGWCASTRSAMCGGHRRRRRVPGGRRMMNRNGFCMHSDIHGTHRPKQFLHAWAPLICSPSRRRCVRVRSAAWNGSMSMSGMCICRRQRMAMRGTCHCRPKRVVSSSSYDP